MVNVKTKSQKISLKQQAESIVKNYGVSSS